MPRAAQNPSWDYACSVRYPGSQDAGSTPATSRIRLKKQPGTANVDLCCFPNRVAIPLFPAQVESVRVLASNTRRHRSHSDTSAQRESGIPARVRIPAESVHQGRGSPVNRDVITETIKASEPARTQTGREGEVVGGPEDAIVAGIGRFIDRLISKWDAMPEAKQDQLIERFTSDVRAASDQGIGTARNEAKRRERALTKLGRSLVVTVGAGLLVAFAGGWFWTLVLILFGTLPTVKRLSELVTNARSRAQQAKERPRSLERKVLSVASGAGGDATVIDVAFRGGMSLEEAQTTLDSLTARGYAEMEISDEGVVHYRIPDLSREASRP